jgi:hypothetical protein
MEAPVFNVCATLGKAGKYISIDNGPKAESTPSIQAIRRTAMRDIFPVVTGDLEMSGIIKMFRPFNNRVEWLTHSI